MTQRNAQETRAGGLAGVVLRLASFLVPGTDRNELLEEWHGELEAARRGGLGPGARLRFALGALPHAVWLRADHVRTTGLALDFRVALRALARRPAFALSAIATLALGLGAAASVFSLLDGVILRPPVGVEAPNRLVQVGRSSPDEPGWNAYSWQSTLALRDASRSFDAVEGYSVVQVELAGEENGAASQALFSHYVTGGWFEMLGTQPVLGRLIDRGDTEQIGGPPVVVLGFDLWRTRFGSDPGIVGQSVLLSGDRYDVVGVAPEGFSGIHNVGIVPQLFIPATLNPGYAGNLPFNSWQWAWVNLTARLAPDADFAAARLESERLGTLLTESDPSKEPTTVTMVQGVGVDPVRSETIAQVARATATIAALLLLLTCVTVANLLLSRALGRRSDTRVRLALGADKGRIVRHHLAESIVLVGAAAALTIPLIVFGTGLLPRFVDLPLVRELAPDARVLGALGAVLAAVTLLFAWIPGRVAVLTAGRAPGIARRSGKGTGKIRSGLLLAQFSISLAFLSAAGLLGRSVAEAWAADPGFEAEGLWGGFLWLDRDAFDGSDRADFGDRVIAELRARPDVRTAAWSTQLPIAGGQSMSSVSPLGRPDVEPQVEMTGVGDGWFETMGVRLLAGVAPSAADPRGVVIGERLAEILFPGEEALGQQLERGWRVVGVAPDVRMRSLRAEGNPAVWYLDDSPDYERMALSVSMQPGAEEQGGRVLETALATIDPDQSISVVRMRTAVLDGVEDARRLGLALTLVAVLALLLTGAGIFGVAAQRATERRHEFGIRLTLGAAPSSLPQLLLGGWAALSLLGLALGSIGAVAMGRALGGILFETEPADPLALGFAGLLLGAVALVATWWPAARAAQLDPLETLRETM
ncbi:MAG: ABC transporter permease [Gemmatimonadota bacterium]